MSLRIRRGTEAERSGLSTVDQGELLWVTNAQKLYVGLGNGQSGNNGMVNIGAALAGDGLAWDEATQTLKFGGVNYTTDDVQEGVIPGRQYFTDERAVDAVAAALVAGTGNVTFVYNTTQDNAGRIDATVTLDGIGITSVEADTSPSLGGDLDLSSNDITGTGNIGITGTIANELITLSGSTITSTELTPGGSDRSDAPLRVGSNANPNTLWVTSDNNFGVLRGLTDGTNNSGITFKLSRGTLAVPAINNAGDGIAFIDALAHDGTSYVNVGAFGIFTDIGWNGTVGVGSSVPGSFGAIVLDEFGTTKELSFNSKGIFNVPIIQVKGYPTGSLPATTGNLEEGYIAFDSTTKQFKGWNGTVWVVLG